MYIGINEAQSNTMCASKGFESAYCETISTISVHNQLIRTLFEAHILSQLQVFTCLPVQSDFKYSLFLGVFPPMLQI